MDNWLQHCEKTTAVEQEWDNIKNTTEKNRRKLRGDKTYTNRRRYLKIWDNEIKLNNYISLALPTLSYRCKIWAG
jgi:hypothetical protein